MAIQGNELASVVVQHIRKDWFDALTKENAFWKEITTTGKEEIRGGINIQFPIKLLANTASGFISGSGSVVSVTPSPQLQYGVLNWKYYYANANFSLEDYNIADKAPEAVVDFIQAKKDGAISDAVREQSAYIQGSSTVAPLAYEGLKDVTASSGTAYAGLLDTDYAPGTYLPFIDSTSNSVNYALVNRLIQKVKARAQQSGVAGKYNPNFGLWNESVQEKFLNAAQNQQRFYEVKQLESGFEGIKVNGVAFYMDANVAGSQDGVAADNYLYVFPIEIMKFMFKYGLGNASPFDGEVQLPNQPVKSYQVYSSGNLVCVNRRLISVAKNLIA